MVQTLLINYAVSGSDTAAGGSVIIEQDTDQLSKYGKTSRLDAVKYMSSLLYGTDAPYTSCVRDGGLVIPVYVYPFPIDLNYQFKACVGNVAPVMVEQHEVSEIMDLSGDNSRKPKYPVLSLLSAAWQGDVFDINGGTITPPTVKLIDGNIVLSSDAVGNLEVAYLTMRHVYNLTLTVADLVGGKFTDWVYAVWDGGIEWHEITGPACSEIADDDADCGWSHGGWRSSGRVGGDDDDDPPLASPVNDTIEIDYCTQEIK